VIVAESFEQRESRRERFSALLDVPLSALALVSLALIIVEFTVSPGGLWSGRVAAMQTGVWLIFLAAFIAELSLAPRKVDFVRGNWIIIVALVVPAFRLFRAFALFRFVRASRVLRGLSVIRVSTSINRAGRALRNFVRVSQLVYVALLTILVTAGSGAGVYYLERGAGESNITTVGDALWWAATTVTTINSPLEPVTLEARIIALLLRVFGLVVVGYVTARLAVFLLGDPQHRDDVHALDNVDALRREVRRLRAELERRER
jgi:voltage-gated potassium channel